MTQKKIESINSNIKTIAIVVGLVFFLVLVALIKNIYSQAKVIKNIENSQCEKIKMSDFISGYEAGKKETLDFILSETTPSAEMIDKVDKLLKEKYDQ